MMLSQRGCHLASQAVCRGFGAASVLSSAGVKPVPLGALEAAGSIASVLRLSWRHRSAPCLCGHQAWTGRWPLVLGVTLKGPRG